MTFLRKLTVPVRVHPWPSAEAGDDERRARLIDEDGVDLVDDGEGVTALHELDAKSAMLSRR